MKKTSVNEKSFITQNFSYPIISIDLFLFSGDDESVPPSVIQTPTAEPEETTTQYTLTVSAGEGGSVSTEGGKYQEETEVTITAWFGENIINPFHL